MNTYFFSDPHYGQKNIVRGVSEWPMDKRHECRDFETIEDMNSAIVNSINSVAEEGDDLYCLGDWSFGGVDNMWEFRKQINCNNVHLVLGNHDDHIRNNKIIRIHKNDYHHFARVSGKSIFHWHEANLASDTDYMLIPCQDMFASVREILNVKINDQRIIMCHYPFRSWHHMEKGAWMLHGHEHGEMDEYTDKDDQLLKTMDMHLFSIGVPMDFWELKYRMDKRTVAGIGHHHKNKV